MIGKLKGLVDELAPGAVIIDVGGVGYLVNCSARTLGRLPRPGEATVLLIETHVREDAISLYGFGDEAERSWFRLLTSVQGVGAKVALSLLGVLAPGKLGQAILAKDRTALSQADGVGPKLATRILNELQDKVGGIVLAEEVGTAAQPASAGPSDEGEAQAVSALVNLGYRRPEAANAIAGARRTLGPEATLDALIRAGLKALLP